MKDLGPEIEFNFTRSSGPGGQNVNKVSTRVELRFNVLNSALLSRNQKEKILKKLKNRISNSGDLILTSNRTRSQHKNKDIVTEKFYKLLEGALARAKPRINTKPTLASKEKRLKNKKILSEKKETRKKPET